MNSIILSLIERVLCIKKTLRTKLFIRTQCTFRLKMIEFNLTCERKLVNHAILSPVIRPKKYMCVSGFKLRKLGMVGRNNILFVKIFYSVGDVRSGKQ